MWLRCIHAGKRQRVLGIAGVVLLVVGGVIVGLLLQSGSANPATCG